MTRVNTKSPWVLNYPVRALAIAAMAVGVFMVASFGLIAVSAGALADETGSSGATTASEVAMLIVGLLLLGTGFFCFRAKPPQARGPRLALLVVASIVLFGVVGWTFVQIGSSVLIHSRKGLGLAYFAPRDGQPSVTDPAFAGLADTTSRTCTQELSCIQAFTGDRLTLYRFSAQSEAEQLAQSLGSRGYQSDWIVVEFTDPSLSDELQLYVKQTLDGTWASD